MTVFREELKEDDYTDCRAPTALKPAFQHALPDRRNHAGREQLLCRVRAEFEELGGLKLTLPQAQRLFDLREDICRRVLDTLVEAGLLCTTADSLYVRRREQATVVSGETVSGRLSS